MSQTPLQSSNALLATMPLAEWQRLGPYLEEVDLP